MKKYFLPLPVLFILLFPFLVSAQTDKKKYNASFREFSLRTSLTSYFDFDAGIMLGANYRWSERLSASIEPTWIFYDAFNSAREYKNFPSGIKIRADFRYHFEQSRNESPDFFIATELHYKYTKSDKEDLFGINCQNGQCAFYQNAIYTDTKNEIGGLIKMGMITPFPFVENDRWQLEFYAGFGFKQLDFKETNLPLGGSFVNLPNRGPFGQQSDHFSVPAMPGGIKLVFIL
jgi:hypothetical protein